jgi:hypothetical protein
MLDALSVYDRDAEDEASNVPNVTLAMDRLNDLGTGDLPNVLAIGGISALLVCIDELADLRSEDRADVIVWLRERLDGLDDDSADEV